MSDGDYDDGGYDDGGYDDDGDYDDDECEDGDDDDGDNENNGDEDNDKYLGKKTKRDSCEKNYSKNAKNEDDEDDENDNDEEGDEDDEDEEGDEEDDEEENEDSYEFNCETGEIGEEIVYKDLKGLKNRGKIEWMNKDGESFKPYDFSFKKGNKTIYVDAKATVCDKENDPQPIISENQQEFIDNLKPNERYYIARVNDARSKNPEITYFDAETSEKVNLK